MKKQIVSLILTLVLSIACISAKTMDVQAESTDEAAYASVFNEIRSEEIFYVGANTYPSNDISEISYTFYDIDKNGVKELILKTDGGTGIIYTLVKGEAVRLAYWEGYRNSFLGINELGYMHGYSSDSASSGASVYYKIASNKKSSVCTVISHEADDYAIITPDSTQKVTRAEAEKFEKSISAPYIKLTDWKVMTYITGNPDPHPYAAALNEFLKDTKDMANAVLLDLDGDGIDEVLAVKATQNSHSVVLGIFDVENGKNIAITYGDKESEYVSSSLAITKTGYILIIESEYFPLFKYKSGELTDISLCNYYEPDGKNYYYHNEVTLKKGGSKSSSSNLKSITKSQYDKYIKDYGLSDIYSSTSGLKYINHNYNNYPITDNTAEILAMTKSSADPYATATKSGTPLLKEAVKLGLVPTDLQHNYNTSITRAEMAKLVTTWIEVYTGKTIDKVLSEKNKKLNTKAFSDTSDKYVAYSYALGIVTGTKAPTADTPGIYKPKNALSKDVAAVMLRNAAQTAGMKVSNTKSAGYTDIAALSSKTVASINYCANVGILKGTDKTFEPKKAVTREQAIIALLNLYKLK